MRSWLIHEFPADSVKWLPPFDQALCHCLLAAEVSIPHNTVKHQPIFSTPSFLLTSLEHWTVYTCIVQDPQWCIARPLRYLTSMESRYMRICYRLHQIEDLLSYTELKRNNSMREKVEHLLRLCKWDCSFLTHSLTFYKWKGLFWLWRVTNFYHWIFKKTMLVIFSIIGKTVFYK